jgi:hypothetical protein
VSSKVHSNTFAPYTGLLYRLYNNPNIQLCHYYKTNGNIYIFSHGGLTEKFLSSDLINKYSKVFRDLGLEPGDYESFSMRVQTIEEKIHFINNLYKEVIAKIFNKINIKKNIQFLVILSAKAQCENQYLHNQKCY